MISGPVMGGYLPVVTISFDDRIRSKLLFIVKTGALLHRHTPLTIIHSSVSTVTAIQTSLRTNVVPFLYLTGRRAGGTALIKPQGIWTLDRY